MAERKPLSRRPTQLVGQAFPLSCGLSEISGHRDRDGKERGNFLPCYRHQLPMTQWCLGSAVSFLELPPFHAVFAGVWWWVLLVLDLGRILHWTAGEASMFTC